MEEGPPGPDDLPLDLDLAAAARDVTHESYWRRRAEAQQPRWLACDPAAHGGSWKALFFERLIGAQGAAMRPDDATSLAALRWDLAVAAPFVRHLTLRPSAQAPHLRAKVILHELQR